MHAVSPQSDPTCLPAGRRHRLPPLAPPDQPSIFRVLAPVQALLSGSLPTSTHEGAAGPPASGAAVAGRRQWSSGRPWRRLPRVQLLPLGACLRPACCSALGIPRCGGCFVAVCGRACCRCGVSFSARSCRYKEEEAPACSDQLGAAICEDYKVTQGCSRGELHSAH